MIPVPSGYQDPHGLVFGPEAVVYVQNVSYSKNEQKTLTLRPDGEYVTQGESSYSRLDFSARIFVDAEAFANGKKGIPFYGPDGQDYFSVQNNGGWEDLMFACEEYLESLYE